MHTEIRTPSDPPVPLKNIQTAEDILKHCRDIDKAILAMRAAQKSMRETAKFLLDIPTIRL